VVILQGVYVFLGVGGGLLPLLLLLVLVVLVSLFL
jgi:hypothetical protein